MKRQYRKQKPCARIQRQRGVPKDDPRWNKLFDFMRENDFTMEDFLACVCANFARYNDRLYESRVVVGAQIYKIKIEKWGFALNEIN